MRKYVKFLFCFAAIVSWFVSSDISAASNNISKITILYTSDLHGYIEGVPSEREEKLGGGILRCATIIDSIRQKETNAILLDLGDLFYGSIESFPSKGEIIVKAVQYLKYDFLIPGNHEFDFGKDKLIELYKEIKIPVIACNISGDKPSTPPPIPYWYPFIVITNSGVRIGIVGLTTPLIPRWFRPKYIEGLSFQKSIDALKTTMLYMRKVAPNILILAAHQGLREWKDDEANELNAVLRIFPEFDLVLGAHTHQAQNGRFIKGIPYSQPGYYGLWLGKSTIQFDTQKKKIISIEPELIIVDSSINPHQKLAEKLSPYLNVVKQYGREIVGELTDDLSPTSAIPGQSAAQTLISQAIKEAVDAEVVLHGTLSAALIKKGPLSRWELWRIVPYENTIGKATITISELKEILEENAKFFGKNQFRGILGCQYELLVSPSGEIKIGEILLPAPIKKRGRVTLAVNSYDLASAGNRLPKLREIMERQGNSLVEYDIDTRETVARYLKKHSPYKPVVADGVIVKRK